ncbi:MAG: ECF-type sigma factor [Candidatus Eisenbacteria bacterium]
MSDSMQSEMARLLGRLDAEPDDRDAADRIFAAVHAELKVRAARRLGREDSWSAVDLVHETYLKIVGSGAPPATSRAHFLAIASKAMRQVLIDRVRARDAKKRGGRLRQVTLTGLGADDSAVEVDLADLEHALGELEALDVRMATLVQLRFFGGLTMEEAASQLGISRPTAQRDWRFARSWLLHRLSSDDSTER